MSVFADRPQISVSATLNDQSLVTAAEEVTEKFVAPIEPRSIRAEKPFHASDQVGQWCLDHQMKMVEHQTKRVNLPLGFSARLAQCFKKSKAIAIVHKDRFAPISTIHHVIDGARIFHAQFASHRASLVLPSPGASSSNHGAMMHRNIDVRLCGTDPFGNCSRKPQTADGKPVL